MENMYINHLAVFVCAILSLVLGGLWYSPLLFYKGWKKENNFTDEDLKKVNPAITYSFTFVFALIMSYNMAFFLGDAFLPSFTDSFLYSFAIFSSLMVPVRTR